MTPGLLQRRSKTEGNVAGRRSRVPLAGTALLLVLIIVPISMMMNLSQTPYYLHIAVLTLISASVATSLNLPIRTGYWPVGQAAFMAVGAYTSALLTTRVGLSLPIGLLAAGVMSGMLAWLFGRVTLRLVGTYFILATFAMGEVVRLTILNQGSVLGGSGGISGLTSMDYLSGAFGFTSAATRILSFYYVALLLLVITVVTVIVIYRSSVGRTFDAMRFNLKLAQAQGVNTVRYRIFAFTVSGVIAGFAGALLAHYIQLATPDMFTYVLSVDVVMMNIVGGTHRVLGPLLGAMLIAPLPELLRGVGTSYTQIGYGAVIIVIMLLWPGGLLQLWENLVGIVRRSMSRRSVL